jgi:hypothetical protein
MSRSGATRVKQAPSGVSGRHATQLDAPALEAVGRFVRVLGRCGYQPDAIEREVSAACRKIPKSWARSFPATLREMRDASHVLTLWFSDPAFLDATGNPRALPLRGARASLETLVRRVDRRISASELLSYLLRMRALRVVHSRYVPRDRVLSLRGAGGPDNFRGLRGLLGMLRTLEHNGLPKSRASGWFEAFGSADLLAGMQARSLPLSFSAGAPYAVPSTTSGKARPSSRTVSKLSIPMHNLQGV